MSKSGVGLWNGVRRREGAQQNASYMYLFPESVQLPPPKRRGPDADGVAMADPSSAGCGGMPVAPVGDSTVLGSVSNAGAQKTGWTTASSSSRLTLTSHDSFHSPHADTAIDATNSQENCNLEVRRDPHFDTCAFHHPNHNSAPSPNASAAVSENSAGIDSKACAQSSVPPSGSRGSRRPTRLNSTSEPFRSIPSQSPQRNPQLQQEQEHQHNNPSLDSSAHCWYPKRSRSADPASEPSREQPLSMKPEAFVVPLPSSSWSCSDSKMEEHTAHSTVTTEVKHLDDDMDDNSTIDSTSVPPPRLTPAAMPRGTPMPSMAALLAAANHNANNNNNTTLGTPSTVSTTPSTDLEVPAMMHDHRRVPSWDSVGHHGNSNHSNSNAWGPSTPRIASFRDAEPEPQRWPSRAVPPFHPSPHHPAQSHHHHHQPHHAAGPHHHHPSHQHHHHQQQHHHHHNNHHHHHHHHHRQGTPQPAYGPTGARKQQQPYPAPAVTPPRGVGPATPRGPTARSPRLPAATAGSRSSSEVLKTLLRKKACLYEPDTSRAVALVTWLVGRELALEFGFFSRQQLQAGVHACVGDKIESGLITRTKVNRCMQIILNSCFHYIIPRPDGTEESGTAFCQIFRLEVSDDVALLRMLPPPWNDLQLDRELVLQGWEEHNHQQPSTPLASTPTTRTPKASPNSSPRLGSVPTSPTAVPAMDEGDGKRAVLLCFNENVRCADDVFRCHNEFIKDTAHAAHLQLSSQEWRIFFGPHAAGAPYVWDGIGIPVAHTERRGPLQPDALGVMTRKECDKFRTTWCSKRYDHDHELCGFAHMGVNQGWLRRDPSKHIYQDKMCPHIVTLQDHQNRNANFVVHSCPHGTRCDHAHSWEEIAYHPQRYKTKTCPHTTGCANGDVCPHHHAADHYRVHPAVGATAAALPVPRGHHAAATNRRGHHPAHDKQQQHRSPPQPAPVVYTHPAPVSEFEKHLQLAGLQSLYRRQCAVLCTHLKGEPCYYRPFGDADGLGHQYDISDNAHQKRGLPPAHAEAQPEWR